jgi:hypothetical protein
VQETDAGGLPAASALHTVGAATLVDSVLLREHVLVCQRCRGGQHGVAETVDLIARLRRVQGRPLQQSVVDDRLRAMPIGIGGLHPTHGGPITELDPFPPLNQVAAEAR